MASKPLFWVSWFDQNQSQIILFVTSSWSISLPKQKPTFTPLVSSIHIQWWFWLFWMVATNNCDHSICFFCACGDSGSNSAIKVNLIVILDQPFNQLDRCIILFVLFIYFVFLICHHEALNIPSNDWILRTSRDRCEHEKTSK